MDLLWKEGLNDFWEISAVNHAALRKNVRRWTSTPARRPACLGEGSWRRVDIGRLQCLQCSHCVLSLLGICCFFNRCAIAGNVSPRDRDCPLVACQPVAQRRRRRGRRWRPLAPLSVSASSCTSPHLARDRPPHPPRAAGAAAARHACICPTTPANQRCQRQQRIVSRPPSTASPAPAVPASRAFHTTSS